MILFNDTITAVHNPHLYCLLVFLLHELLLHVGCSMFFSLHETFCERLGNRFQMQSVIWWTMKMQARLLFSAMKFQIGSNTDVGDIVGILDLTGSRGWWHLDVGNSKLVTGRGCWWQNLDVDETTKNLSSTSLISDWRISSPTFVTNTDVLTETI